jgi:hypothetical protein
MQTLQSDPSSSRYEAAVQGYDIVSAGFIVKQLDGPYRNSRPVD